MTAPCTVCDRPRRDFPSIFRGDPECSVVCKKAAEAEVPTAPVVAESECGA